MKDGYYAINVEWKAQFTVRERERRRWWGWPGKLYPAKWGGSASHSWLVWRGREGQGGSRAYLNNDSPHHHRLTSPKPILHCTLPLAQSSRPVTRLHHRRTVTSEAINRSACQERGERGDLWWSWHRYQTPHPLPPDRVQVISPILKYMILIFIYFDCFFLKCAYMYMHWFLSVLKHHTLFVFIIYSA